MTVFQESCSPVGPEGCRGRNEIPVSNIALTLAMALIKLAKGEDLRPMLRQGPSEYELYQRERAAAEDRLSSPITKAK